MNEGPVSTLEAAERLDGFRTARTTEKPVHGVAGTRDHLTLFEERNRAEYDVWIRVIRIDAEHIHSIGSLG